jgi:hypothetical protein
VQGDQIGRIFAQRAIVYLGNFLKITYISSPNLYAIFPISIKHVLILTKNGLGYVLGDFFQTHLVTLVVANGLFPHV